MKDWKKFGLHKKNNLIHSDGNKYLTVDSLIKLNNIITGSNNITLRKVDLKPYRFDKMYIVKDIIEDQPYQMHPLYYGNNRYRVRYRLLMIMKQ